MQTSTLPARALLKLRWGGRLAGPPLVVWVPAVLATAVLLLPIAYLILRASGASADVWESLFRARTLEILLRTLGLIAAVGGLSVALAVPLAWLTVRTDLPYRRGIAVLSALPLVIPSYVGAFLLISALGPRGTLQQILQGPFGVQQLPSLYGFPGTVLCLTLLSYPYVYLGVRAALWKLDPSLEEAARSLGRSARQTLLLVILPTLRPAIAGGFLLVALYVLSDFGAVALLRYETFTWAIYLQYRGAFDRTGAAALSLVLAIFALALLHGEMATRGTDRYARVGSGVVRTPQIARLGGWRWPAFALSALVLAFALGLPVAMLAYWIVLGVMSGEQLDPVWQLATNSVYVSAIAAVVTAATALPVAVLIVRFRSVFSQWIEQASYVAFALPGIVIALALVFFGAQYAPFIYQALPLLILAYLIHFLPTALGSLRTALLNVNPNVEEAARSLGHGPLRALLEVTLPLVRPGLFAGMAMVFLLTMKELPATLLLSPIGFKTLATSVWSFAEAGFFARTAFPTLVLLAVSSIPMAVLITRDSR